jgi:hypothetical protein
MVGQDAGERSRRSRWASGVAWRITAAGSRKRLVSLLAALGEPSQEGSRVLDLVPGVAAGGRGDRLFLRAGAEPWEDFRGREAAHELGVIGVGDAGEVSDEPSL